MIEKEELALEPTADMYMRAHTHYQSKLLNRSMEGLRGWREKQLEKRELELTRFHIARTVFHKKLCARVSCIATVI